MRKKFYAITTLVVMMGLVGGCGSRAKATNADYEDEETIIVGDDVSTSEEITAENEGNEVLETDVISDDTEVETGEFAGAEDENIVLYAERGESEFVPQSTYTYYNEINSVVAKEDIPLYDGEGCNVGYIKTGAIIETTEKAEEATWSRFENTIIGTDYDYLYVMNDYLVNPNEYIVTDDGLRTDVIETLNNRGYELATILDEPISDMEMFEFRMYSTYMDESDYRFDISYYCDNNGVRGYMTYAIETFEDDGDVVCQIYYSYPYEQWMKDNGISY